MEFGWDRLKLLRGDAEFLLDEIDDNTIDLIVTSPPYFNAKEYSQYKNVNEYMYKMDKIFTKVLNKLKESRMCAIVISPVIFPRKSRSHQSYRIPLPAYFTVMMERIGYEFLEDIVWVKPEGSAKNRNGTFFRSRKPVSYKPNIITESILVFKKKADFLIDKVLKNDSLVVGDYERTNVWHITPKTKSKHPAPFPDELVAKLIKYYSYEGDMILDPFVGSGTTLKVSRELLRGCIGIEEEHLYCKMIEKELNTKEL